MKFQRPTQSQNPQIPQISELIHVYYFFLSLLEMDLDLYFLHLEP